VKKLALWSSSGATRIATALLSRANMLMNVQIVSAMRRSLLWATL
jgi:hypothetical protein